jgi:hypothetical protein
MKYVKIAVVIILVGVLGYVAFMSFATYSDGFRSGKLYKFSKKGNVFKTYEGEIQLAIGDGANFNTKGSWAFSVSASNKDVIANLEAGMEKEVKLHYEEKYWQLPWNGDTKYMVDKVDIIK